MADDLAISVQIGADLDDLDQKLAQATKMVGDFADSLSKTAASGSSNAAKAHGQAADQSTRNWNAAAKSIETSMNTTIGGVLRGTTSLQAGLQKIAVGIEQRFLDMALKVPEEWASGQLRMLVQSLLGENERTGVAQDGMLTRSGIEASEAAVHGAVEVGKTEATATGAAVRGTIETAASSQSIATSIATGIADIAVKAAQAAAGAYAAIAAIPYVGPVLAPVAAAGALAAVFAIGKGIASAEGGWGQVPYDGALTELHKDEMVLPASIASPLRQSLAAPAGQKSGQGSNLTFQFAPTVSAIDATGVDQLLQQHQDTFIKNVRNWHRNGKLGPKGALA